VKEPKLRVYTAPTATTSWTQAGEEIDARDPPLPDDANTVVPFTRSWSTTAAYALNVAVNPRGRCVRSRR
jgi:hypothetical protein